MKQLWYLAESVTPADEAPDFNQAMMDIAPDLDNVIRLQVFGDSEVHAVRVMVDPDAPAVFAFQPMIIAGNTRSRRR